MMKTKLDMDSVREVFRAKKWRWKIETLQVVAYVAAGGGMVGRMYAEQPANAYRDSRSGKAPYSVSDLENIRMTLVAMAEEYGLDPHKLPCIPDFHNCGVF